MSYTLNKRGAQIDAIFLRAEAGGTIDDAIDLKAPLASPALTGTPTAPTAPAGTDTTQIATTAFVTDAVQAEAEAAAKQFAPMIEASVGPSAVASFSDGANGVPIKSGTFQVVPAQDLHGQDYPYPAGGGKNKLDTDWIVVPEGLTKTVNSDGSVTLTTDAYHTGPYRAVLTNRLPAGTYTFSLGSASTKSLFVMTSSSDYSHNVTKTNPFTLTYDGSSYLQIVSNSEIGTSSSATMAVQIESGSSATAFSPYSNICPISGWTAATISRTGKNFWNPANHTNDSNVTYTVNADSSLTMVNAAGSVRTYEAVLTGKIPAGKYTFSAATGSAALYVKTSSTDYNHQFGPNATQTLTYDGQSYLRLNRTLAASSTTTIAVQIERGESKTDYVPYQAPTTYAIDWTDEAGTVYGGTLEYKGGGAWRLTVDRIIYSLTGYESWSTSGSVGNGQRYICQRATYMPLADVSKTEISSHFLWRNSNYDWGAFRITSSNVLVCDASGHFTDHTEFALWLQGQVTAGTPVQFCVYTTSPQTYDLTGADVLTLLGSNAIWSDTGDAAVEYRADTKLYIDGQIAALQALVLENNG